MTRRLRLKDLCPRGEAFHLGRPRLGAGYDAGPHGHDFAEIFWVREGRGEQAAGTAAQALAPGDLVFIRPADKHHVRAFDDEELVLVNLAFPAATLAHLRRRYLPGCAAYFWSEDKLPDMVACDGALLDWLELSAGELAMRPRTPLALEAFLLQLLARLTAVPHEARAPCPAWLREAANRFCTPARLRGGVACFVSLAHRCRTHVNREVRKHYGITTTELVNRLRLRHAAAALAMTDAPIPEAAGESGFASLGHFYRLFRAAYGATPKEYRARSRAQA